MEKNKSDHHFGFVVLPAHILIQKTGDFQNR